MKFIQHINVKLATIVGILNFISRINTSSESYKEITLFFSILAFMGRWNFKLSSVEHDFV